MDWVVREGLMARKVKVSPMNVGGHFSAKGRDEKENNASWKRKLIGQGVVRRRAVELGFE